MASLNCLAELTYEECAALDKNNTIIILPMGPLEAHGPHLPLGVDIQGALILSEMGGSLLAARGMDIAIAPVIPYTLSDAAMPFSGTISLRRETVKVLLSDICASFLHHGFKYLVINCHHLERANMEALDQAALEIEKTGLSVLISRAIMESWAGLPNLLKGEHPSWDFHAGETETAFYLWKFPHLVKEPILKKLPPNWSNIREKFRKGARNFMEAGAPRCYLGDPAKADAEQGRKLYELLAASLAEEVQKWFRACNLS